MSDMTHRGRDVPDDHDVERPAVISILIENESGALARVVGLFAGRGYNIETLCVAPVDGAAHLSRITLETSGTPQILSQIRAQLDRLVPVHAVREVTAGSGHLVRELALVRVRPVADGHDLLWRVAKRLGARLIGREAQALVFELSGPPDRVSAALALLAPCGACEVSRTGLAAIERV